MLRSTLLPLAIVACLIGGSHGAFMASSAAEPNTTNSAVSAVIVIDNPSNYWGVIRVTVANLTDYAWTTLVMGNTSTNVSTILWVDPIRAYMVDSVNPQTKDIEGAITFEYTFSASNLLGPLGNHPGRLSYLWDALMAGEVYVCAATSTDNCTLMALFSPVAEVYQAYLDGQNNVGPNGSTPITTEAVGMSTLTFAPDYSSATVALTIRDVAGYFMSHIHVGNSTSNGPPALWINPLASYLLSTPPQYIDVGILLFNVAFNGTQLTSGYYSRSLNAFATLARTGGLYANVHSETYPNGVIRSQYEGDYPVMTPGK